MCEQDNPTRRERILVAGVGNRLMGDDGFGPRVIDLLSDQSLPVNVELRDVGTASLSIALDLSDYDFVIFMDSMEMEGEPGQISRLEVDVEDVHDDVGEPAGGMLHELGLGELLKISKAIGTLPPRVILVGCKPGDIRPGTKMTAAVERAAHRAADMVLEILGLKDE